MVKWNAQTVLIIKNFANLTACDDALNLNKIVKA